MTSAEHDENSRRPEADNSIGDHNANSLAPDGSPDPFDPKKFAIDGTANLSAVKKALVHVPVRKPNKQEFFRVRSENDYRLSAAVLEMKEEREIYLANPSLALALPGEFRLVDLRVCINRRGDVFIWPVPLPDNDGRSNAWHVTAREAADRAQTRWTRMVANMSIGAYDVYEAATDIGEPIWPEYSFQELLRVAFGTGRIIEYENHPIIQHLLGRA